MPTPTQQSVAVGRCLLDDDDAVNKVTAHIDCEYRVVVLAQHAAYHQTAPERTYIKVSLTQTDVACLYDKGATLSYDPDKVEIHLDATASRPVATTRPGSLKIAPASLTGEGLTLYLKGLAVGTFNLTLTPALAINEHIETEAVTVQIAVVKLQLDLYADAKPHTTVFTDKGAWTRTVMSDQDKVEQGRILHVQSQGRHARAKIVVRKPDDAFWTIGADNYEVHLRNGSNNGDVTVYTTSVNGAVVNLPKALTKGDFAAGDITYWVEGTQATDDFRGAFLVLMLDRPEGGLPKSSKDFADWAPFTIIEFEYVRPSTDNYKQFVNLPQSAAHPEHGRSITSQVKLTKALKGIEIYFRLIPWNRNRADLPKTLNYVRPKGTDVAVKTDVHGIATSQALTLSGFCGDKFLIAAYVKQSPPVSKTIPARSCSKWIEIWKSLRYHITCMKRADGTSYSTCLDEARLKQTFAAVRIRLRRLGAVATKPFQSVLENPGVFQWVAAKQDRVIRFGLVDAVVDGPSKNLDLAYNSLPSLRCRVTLTAHVFDLSAQARWFVSATYYDERNSRAPVSMAIPSASISLAVDGTGHKLIFDLSRIRRSIVNDARVGVRIRLLERTGLSGISSDGAAVISVRSKEGTYPGQAIDAVLHTMLHEGGHALGLASKKLPNAAQGNNPRWYNIGTGNHCNFNTNQCIMYHTITPALTLAYCGNCKRALKARDMSNVPISPTSAF